MDYYCIIYFNIGGDSAVKFLREHPWLLSLVLIILVAGPGFYRVEQINNKTDRTVRCINEWADVSVNRGVVLTDALADKNEKLDILLRAASAADREGLIKGLREYTVASDKYKELLKNNSIPESPKLACN